MRALELDPAHQEAIQLKREREREAGQLRDQAVKFLLLGQREGALNKISTAIECDPSPAEFHVLRCVCVCVFEFGRVLNLNPARCVTRGAIHRQSGEYVRAVDELLTAIDKCGEGRV